MSHVIASSYALYSKPRKCRRRRLCDGHLAERHWIEPGDLVMASALPPDSDDIGNVRWMHAWYCADCWPEERAR